ncbi:hypothetical protein WJ0W_007180 [Paenibacillus melissococcoides]|uniref:Uncharacterized protein n=1 Tax=Paenibacillus melissococcoides TaxID=2912268 RepID=A0ABM9G908_9BACL|nr:MULTISPECIES: hypothetical protein [Paenibacillus]GIO81879.1 hypothetical protein J6TS7_54890 [Paenibacillus dendritiformis]CAH8248512.1 hypothetical protein WJ0W_007180 [Paenibacillus melissococcoides]CAH8722004.1 hypothetical protein HTL2_006645 [Paenibacillus melissococcoides]CAH8722056.1 hypothetical protein WDD9_006599 [Paenibacillus melissococcoides]
MKKNHLSVNQRLKRVRKLEVKKEIALDWVEGWQEEHDDLIRQLERAIRNDDYDLLCRATGQLKTVGQKRFEALPKILVHLADSPSD